MGKKADAKSKKIGTRRISRTTGDSEETRRLKNLQDGKCTEGGCERPPTYKLEEKMADGWAITDFLCTEHANEWASRCGLGWL